MIAGPLAFCWADRHPHVAGAQRLKYWHVAYDGFAASLPGLVALVLFGTWIITMVVLMWRPSTRTVSDTGRMHPPCLSRPDAAATVPEQALDRPRRHGEAVHVVPGLE